MKTKKIHIGDLVIEKDTTIDFTEITGNLIVKLGVKLVAEKLTTIGGYLSINAQASLPKLETIGGYLYINAQASLPKLETIGGYLSISAAGLFDAPEKLKQNDPVALALAFKKKGLIKVDGILSWIISKKRIGNIVAFKVRIVGKREISFIVQRGEAYSHGKTIKEAKDSLKFKISSRDTSEFKKWDLKTIVTQAKMIQAYRVITGACEFGVREFCKGKKLPAKVSVSRAIEITEGAYGNETFREFFKGKGAL